MRIILWKSLWMLSVLDFFTPSICFCVVMNLGDHCLKCYVSKMWTSICRMTIIYCNLMLRLTVAQMSLIKCFHNTIQWPSLICMNTTPMAIIRCNSFTVNISSKQKKRKPMLLVASFPPLIFSFRWVITYFLFFYFL